ncbi:MAG TPA: glycosyltransferase family 39 protein [Thermoanaerobaculia bacterium]
MGQQERLSRAEAKFLAAAAACAFLLRVALIFRYRFDSDEPQHMHVAWAWARGLMQYRDVFDNHMPLFHLMSAPLFRVTGDDVNALYLARLWVLPFFLASLVLVFVIGDRLFGRRIAAWATALAAAFPPFFLGMLEYRTDDLWVMLWLACIAVLLTDMEPQSKALLAGAILGFAFGVSMKSVLFALAIAVASIGTILLTRHRFASPPLRDVAGSLTTVFMTASILPIAIAMFFALNGAWQAFAYCVIWHNAGVPFDGWWRVVWAIPLTPLTLGIARRVAAAEGIATVVRQRLFLFLLAASYVIVLSAFWPLLSFEDYLPFYPLIVVLATRLLLGAAGSTTRIPAIAAASLVVVIIATAATGHLWHDEAHNEEALIRQVLQITRPNDPVMDLKGEVLFRRRPYWLVLESITHRKLRHRMLRDDIAAALVRSGTAVLASTDFPARTRFFVRRHYLPWGRLWVVGQSLPAVAVRGVAVPFRVDIASTYIVVNEHGVVAASIDGVPVGNGIDLGRGVHRLLVSRPVSRPLVVWSGVIRSARFPARLRDTETYLRALREHRRLIAGNYGDETELTP